MITRRQRRTEAGSRLLPSNSKPVPSGRPVRPKKTDNNGTKLQHKENRVGTVNNDTDMDEVMDEPATLSHHNGGGDDHYLHGETYISPLNADPITSASNAENSIDEIQVNNTKNLFESQQQPDADVDVEFEEYYRCNICLTNFISLAKFEAHECYIRQISNNNNNKNGGEVIEFEETAAASTTKTNLEPVITHDDESNTANNNHKIIQQEPADFCSSNSNSSYTNFNFNPCAWDDDDEVDSSTDPLGFHPDSFGDPLDDDQQHQHHEDIKPVDHSSFLPSNPQVCENQSSSSASLATAESPKTILVPVQALMKQLQSKRFLVTSLGPQKKIIRLTGSNVTVHDIFGSLSKSSSFPGPKFTPILLKPPAGRRPVPKLEATTTKLPPAKLPPAILPPPAKLPPKVTFTKPSASRSNTATREDTLVKSKSKKTKKEGHEHVRRKELSDNFSMVRDLVPWLRRNEKCSKVRILTDAASYIKALEEEEKTLLSRTDVLKEKRDKLKARVDKFLV